MSVVTGHAQAEESQYVASDHSTNWPSDAFRPETPAGQRQKRRRTSPRDHAILESAYQRNSKPDKEERLNLVQKVDLGEKEVQIWFQNRRQNDRRKAKPLQPHELIPHFRNGIPMEASKQLPSPEASQILSREEDTRLVEVTPIQSSAEQSSPRYPSSSGAPNALHLQHNTSSPCRSLRTPPSSAEKVHVENEPDLPSMVQDPLPDTTLSKKRSYEQMTETEPQPVAADDSQGDAKHLRRTSSFVRLAVTADGAVKVRINDETTPSPPKQRPQPPPEVANRRSSGFQRAQSDLSHNLNVKFRDARNSVKGLIGRSRDARTWEFYCDRSSRSSLATRAEQAATGSAVGALGLMRSASQKKNQVLTPNRARQNNSKRVGVELKAKPNLTRARSSMARLQGSDSTNEQDDLKQGKSDYHRRSSGSDSDKENWMPGTRNSVQARRAVDSPSQEATALDQSQGFETENDITSSQALADSDKRNRPIPASGKTKVDDLDCVQGLLSLSQGAWR